MLSKLGCALAVFAAGGGALWLQAEKSQPATAVPAGARVLRLSGLTSARQFVNINAPKLRGGPEGGSQAMILMKLVKAGAAVKKGQLIADIDSQTVKDHVDDVADMVRQAKSDIVKRQAEQAVEWEIVQKNLRQSKADYEKAQLDARTAGILTEIERELLQLTVEETGARYKQLQKDLEYHRAANAAEIRILEITRDRQERHLLRHQRDLDHYTINAPMDGLAVMQQMFRGGDMTQIQEGDQIWPGMLFMKVVNTSTMQVEAKANQAESSDLRVGQKVKIHLDAFPGIEFTGTVHSIGALAVGGWMQNYYIRNIPVNIWIDGSDPHLIPDMSAACDITIEPESAAPVAAVPRTVPRS
ncbi:MAG: efflux RND transporter periplasmic adaptor subunit [Acidobacteriota bacterium]|nr:efflux RND transporter periplasmic adaptor subunit [Acidobacteriota bacterium]